MTIQQKTLFIILFGLASTIGVIYTISNVIVTSSFQQLESKYVRADTQRVFQVLMNELDHMSTFAEAQSDWEMFFINLDDSSVEDAQEYLIDNSSTIQRYNLVTFFNNDGSLIYSRFKNNNLPGSQALPPSWQEKMSPEHPLFIPRDSKGRSNGLLKMPDGTALLVNSKSIQQNSLEETPKGTLILGQLLDIKKIQRLVRVSNISMELLTFEHASTDNVNGKFYKSLTVSAPHQVRIFDEQVINGFLLLKDVRNQPAFILKISFPRDIYRQGKITLEYYTKLLLLVGITIVLFVLLLMNQLVLSRLKRLDKGIRKVLETGDLKNHIKMDGKDEFKYLAEKFNELLDSLRLSQEELEKQIGERNETQAKLELYQDKLRSLMSELALVEEKERRRISVELHDNTIQNLGLSKFKLSVFRNSLDKDTPTNILDEVILIIDSAIKDTRNLIFELSPPILYELGFVPAIEWLAEKFHLERDLVCEVKDDGKNKPLDHAISVILFQIIRELLVNIVKHAKADKATITMSQIDERVKIEVKDDGVGFDISALGKSIIEPQGYGLFSIRERLSNFGENLDIDSTPGGGTVISFAAPLKSTN